MMHVTTSAKNVQIDCRMVVHPRLRRSHFVLDIVLDDESVTVYVEEGLLGDVIEALLGAATKLEELRRA